MVIFDNEKVLLLQKMVMEKTGQKVIVRDFDILDSSVQSVFQTFAEVELYPTIEEKGARLGFNIICNHPFVDGNKRCGVLVMLSFLKINGVNLKFSDSELINVGLSIAEGKMKFEELVNWVNAHKCPTETKDKER